MSISQKDIREHEEEFRNLLYDKIGETISKQSEVIMRIGEMGQYMDIDTDVPNMGITFNNKLNELLQEFRRAGISLFAEPNEKHDFVGSNFVGNAIIEDMISQLSNGTQALSEYDSSISKTVKKKTGQVQALENVGLLKKLFFKIISIFVPTTISDIASYSQEDIEEINSHLLHYKDIDDKLWKYNLRDNVAQSIASFIKKRQYQDFVIPDLVQESVVPTLQKLGLEEIIPQLQEELSKQKEEPILSSDKSWNLLNYGINKEDFMQQNTNFVQEHLDREEQSIYKAPKDSYEIV